jgi:hypothetical protein
MKTIAFKSSLLLVLAFLFPQLSHAQKPLESPRANVSGKTKNSELIIDYGSPSVRGRKIWGELVPYGQVWRAGANEATTFSTSQPVMVEGKALPAGKYALFMIPGEKNWTIIFNKQAEQWGAYKYDEKQDALRVTVTPKAADMHEQLTYKITSSGFSLFWDKLEIPVSIP